jgi:membrane protein YqaA with SNARE-associated domain
MDIAVYGGLFFAAFGAASLLPMQSEALLAGLLIAGDHSTPLLIAAASLGNIIGSVINWALGRSIERFGGRRWFPASPAQLDRASRWYQKYGRYSLLLSWVPVIGDPITLIAGVLREPLLPFLILVSVAKISRYLVVTAVALSWA